MIIEWTKDGYLLIKTRRRFAEKSLTPKEFDSLLATRPKAMCTYDCAKCGTDFQDELYPDRPQNLSDNYDFLCPDCKKTIQIKDDEVHRKLFTLMREIRFAHERYGQSCEDSDLNEMNEKQLEIIVMFDELKTHTATSDFCSAEWKNDFDKAKIVIQKIDNATTSDDYPMERVLVIKNIIEDYNQENK